MLLTLPKETEKRNDLSVHNIQSVNTFILTKLIVYQWNWNSISCFYFYSEDDYVAQAGYTEKFKTWIIIYHNGTSEWNSPVSFKSSCNFDVTYFPYDEHRCELIFGSPTSDITLMDIVTDERRLEREKGQDRSENVEKEDGDEAFGKFVNLRTKRPA